MMNQFFQVLRLPATSLRTLEAGFAEGRWLHAFDPVFPSLFNGQTPQIDKLVMHNCISWPAHFSPNLIQLEFRNRYNRRGPVLSTFLDMLEASPLLQALILAEFHLVYDEVHMDRVIDLHALKEVQLLRFDNYHILRHISLPAEAFLQIKQSGSPFSAFLGLPHLRNLSGLSHVTVSVTDEVSMIGRNQDNVAVIEVACKSESWHVTLRSLLLGINIDSVRELSLIWNPVHGRRPINKFIWNKMFRFPRKPTSS